MSPAAVPLLLLPLLLLSPSLPLPLLISLSVSFPCCLSRQLKLIRIFIKFQCLKGCKASCTWPLPPHRTPCSPCHCLIPPPHPPCPLLFIVVAQNALQRFTVLAGGREKEASWRKLRRRNPRRPQCKAADKVFSPSPVTVQELGEKRRLAGQPLGLPRLGLNRLSLTDCETV